MKIKFFFRGLMNSLALVALIFSIFSLLNNNEIEGNISSEVGTEVYFYDNYRWSGLKHLRDKNHIVKVYDNSTVELLNKKLIMSVINNTSVMQSSGYSYTVTNGYVLSQKVKANLEYFEYEVAIAINTAVEETISASMNIPPFQTISLYSYDNRTRVVGVSNYIEEEIEKWGKWKFYQELGYFYETLHEYGGVTLEIEMIQ